MMRFYSLYGFLALFAMNKAFIYIVTVLLLLLLLLLCSKNMSCIFQANKNLYLCLKMFY